MAEQRRLQEPALRIALDEAAVKARKIDAQGDPTGRALREFARIDLLLRTADRWTDGNPIGDIDIPPALVEVVQSLLGVTDNYTDDTRPEPVETRYMCLNPATTVTNVSLGHGRVKGDVYIDKKAFWLVFSQPAPQQ